MKFKVSLSTPYCSKKNITTYDNIKAIALALNLNTEFCFIPHQDPFIFVRTQEIDIPSLDHLLSLVGTLNGLSVYLTKQCDETCELVLDFMLQ